MRSDANRHDPGRSLSVDGERHRIAGWSSMAATLAALLVLTVLLPAPWRLADITRSDDPVTAAGLGLCSAVVWGLLIWGTLIAIGAALGRLPGLLGVLGRRLLARVVPASGRQLLAVTLGIGVLGGAASALVTAWTHPAEHTATAGSGASDTADDRVVGTTRGVPSAGPVVPAGLSLQFAARDANGVTAWSADPTDATSVAAEPLSFGDRAAPAPPEPGAIGVPSVPTVLVGVDWPSLNLDWPTSTRTSRTGEPAPAEVVVHRGDSLWAIAARALPPDATDADIARSVDAWYSANRQVIGDDPNLILPGQRLLPPSTP
jgi:resuscitation-promoting factor RpfA